ncbi:MAG: rhodanese-like domain-containing protein [Acidobacteriota bacterium]
MEASRAATGPIREELDRKTFYFRTLYETSRELEGLIQPARIMDAFLLMAMGALGSAWGMVALIDGRGEGIHVARRGLGGSDESCCASVRKLCERYFAGGAIPAGLPPRMEVLDESDGSILPSGGGRVVLWSLAVGYSGLVALGPEISGVDSGEDHSYLLLNLTDILIAVLFRALSTISVQQLNADLAKKNETLEKSLQEVQRSRAELDRHIYHLQSLSDLNSELSPIIRIRGLLQTYLLVTMGTFGVGQGFVLFYDREAETSKTVRIVARGMESREDLSAGKAERLLFRCFEAAETRRLAPMGMSRIANPSEIFSEAGIEIDVQTALLYYVDQTSLGIVGFGPGVTGSSLSSEEENLLFTHTASLMIFLKNGRAFEKVNILNEGLVRKNEELTRTITELTEARRTIAILERAGAQIKAAVQRELERSSRMNPLDIALIFVVSAILGLLFNFANPQGIRLLPDSLFRPPVETVDAPRARELIDSGGAVLIDARPKELYEKEHVKGAINLPPALFDIIYMMKLSKLDPGREIVVFGRSVSKRYDEEVAHRLKQRDHERIRILNGDMDSLKAHGYQVEK